eukprot:Nk52_evm42s152 gene=Nk52_evmTU42s152
MLGIWSRPFGLRPLVGCPWSFGAPLASAFKRRSMPLSEGKLNLAFRGYQRGVFGLERGGTSVRTTLSRRELGAIKSSNVQFSHQKFRAFSSSACIYKRRDAFGSYEQFRRNNPGIVQAGKYIFWGSAFIVFFPVITTGLYYMVILGAFAFVYRALFGRRSMNGMYSRASGGKDLSSTFENTPFGDVARRAKSSQLGTWAEPLVEKFAGKIFGMMGSAFQKAGENVDVVYNNSTYLLQDHRYVIKHVVGNAFGPKSVHGLNWDKSEVFFEVPFRQQSFQTATKEISKNSVSLSYLANWKLSNGQNLQTQVDLDAIVPENRHDKVSFSRFDVRGPNGRVVDVLPFLQDGRGDVAEAEFRDIE